MVAVLQYDETETGPRTRKTLTDKHGITCKLEQSDVGGVATHGWTLPVVDLYSYVRPSNGQILWLVEARIFFPPDVVLYRSWVLDDPPTPDEIRDIVATDRQPEVH